MRIKSIFFVFLVVLEVRNAKGDSVKMGGFYLSIGCMYSSQYPKKCINLGRVVSSKIERLNIGHFVELGCNRNKFDLSFGFVKGQRNYLDIITDHPSILSDSFCIKTKANYRIFPFKMGYELLNRKLKITIFYSNVYLRIIDVVEKYYKYNNNSIDKKEMFSVDYGQNKMIKRSIFGFGGGLSFKYPVNKQFGLSAQTSYFVFSSSNDVYYYYDLTSFHGNRFLQFYLGIYYYFKK